MFFWQDILIVGAGLAPAR